MSTQSHVGFAVNVVSNIGSGHQVSTMFNLPVGASAEDFNANLDLLMKVLDRQSARLRLPELEAERDRLVAKLIGQESAIARLDEHSTKAQSHAGKQERAALIDRIQSDRDVLALLEKNIELTRFEAE